MRLKTTNNLTHSQFKKIIFPEIWHGFRPHKEYMGNQQHSPRPPPSPPINGGRELFIQAISTPPSPFASLISSSFCCDCASPKPIWCDTEHNHVLLCNLCAGVHRGFSNKVRSLTLDQWSEEAQSNVLNAKEIELEYHVPKGFLKPGPFCASADRKRFIEAKYVGLEFCKNDAERKEARKADKAVAHKNIAVREGSFLGGKELMVGVVDLKIVSVVNMPKPIIKLGRGFTLHCKLGRFAAKTKSSWSGNKWITDQPMHLSWDGTSSLKVFIETPGSSIGSLDTKKMKILCRGTRHLKHSLNESGTIQFWLTMKKNFEMEKDKDDFLKSTKRLASTGGSDGPNEAINHVERGSEKHGEEEDDISIQFQLNFVDLR